MDKEDEEDEGRSVTSSQVHSERDNSSLARLDIQKQSFNSALNFAKMAEQLQLLKHQGPGTAQVGADSEALAQTLANEQAKLIETFQSVRQWQQQQQAALIRQQQEQMHQLLAEQDRISSLIGNPGEGSPQTTPQHSPSKSGRRRSSLSPHVQSYNTAGYNQLLNGAVHPEYDTDDGVYPMSADSQGPHSPHRDASEVESSEEPSSAQEYDEKPIRGVTKTFEQLLEEQLANEQLASNQSELPAKKASVKFLKRGEGLSRFNLKENITPNKEWKPCTKTRQPLVDYSRPVLKAKPREPTPPECKKKISSRQPAKVVKPVAPAVARKVAGVAPHSPTKTLTRSYTMPVRRPAQNFRKNPSNDQQPSTSTTLKSPLVSSIVRSSKPLTTTAQPGLSSPRKNSLPTSGRPASAMESLSSISHIAKPTSPKKKSTSPRKIPSATHSKQTADNAPSAFHNPPQHNSNTPSAKKSVDSSFITNIKHRVHNEAVETEELQVFELLEQFADGDESFRSDCTLVKEVLKPKVELSPLIKSRIDETKPGDNVTALSHNEPARTPQDDVSLLPFATRVEVTEDQSVKRPPSPPPPQIHNTAPTLEANPPASETSFTTEDSLPEHTAPAEFKEAVPPIKRKIAYAKPPSRLLDDSDNIESSSTVMFGHGFGGAAPAAVVEDPMVDLPARPAKPMFVDESAEWEDESTLGTPAKHRLERYLSECDLTPSSPQRPAPQQPAPHQPPPHQPASHRPASQQPVPQQTAPQQPALHQLLSNQPWADHPVSTTRNEKSASIDQPDNPTHVGVSTRSDTDQRQARQPLPVNQSVPSQSGHRSSKALTYNEDTNMEDSHTETTVDSSSDTEDPPQQSQLLQKLFPALKSVQQNRREASDKEAELKAKFQPIRSLDVNAAQVSAKPSASPTPSAKESAADVQALVSMTPTLKSKLTDLEKEIERFRMENTELAKLKKERQDSVAKLKKEMAEFQAQKDEELQRLNEHVTKETKKLKQDRKLFEAWQKQQQLLHNKRDRQEIDALSHELEEVKQESKRKEQRWTSNTARLRDRVEALESEKQELKAKVDELEKINAAQQQLWKQAESNSKQQSVTQVAKKVDEQWSKIMDSVENQTTTSRHGRRTPLASTTHSLNVKNSQQTSQLGAPASSVSSSTVTDRHLKVGADRKMASDHSASSSERVKPGGPGLRRTSAVHTAPVISSAYTDDTDNDVTTDSDMAHTEEEEGKKAAISSMMTDLGSARHDTRSSHTGRVRPASAQDRHKTSRDRTSSRPRDRHTSHEKSLSYDRHRSRDRVISKDRDVPTLPLDRQEPDGRSSRQGRVEDKSADTKASRSQSSRDASEAKSLPPDRHSRKQSGGRNSGQSLDRGNNTGSSEPPTVIEILGDGRTSRQERPQTSPPKSNRQTSPIRRSQSSRDRSSDRPSLRRGYGTDRRRSSSTHRNNDATDVKENLSDSRLRYDDGVSPDRSSRMSPRRRRSPERAVSRRTPSKDRVGKNASRESLDRSSCREVLDMSRRRHGSKDRSPSTNRLEDGGTVDGRINSIGSKKSLTNSGASSDESSPINAPRLHRGDQTDRQEVVYSDGKREYIYSTGAREIFFSNRTRKEISPDGKNVVVKFFNGDRKHIQPDQSLVYYYAEAKTTHTTYPDGVEIVQFANKQVEKLLPSGMKEIIFPDGAIKYLHPDGKEETTFPDGTVVRVVNGVKILEMPNGQKEIHTNSYKRREYPDGTVKTVYNDGRQETKYSNGRVRIKDAHGNIIVDRVS